MSLGVRRPQNVSKSDHSPSVPRFTAPLFRHPRTQKTTARCSPSPAMHPDGNKSILAFAINAYRSEEAQREVLKKRYQVHKTPLALPPLHGADRIAGNLVSFFLARLAPRQHTSWCGAANILFLHTRRLGPLSVSGAKLSLWQLTRDFLSPC